MHSKRRCINRVETLASLDFITRVVEDYMKDKEVKKRAWVKNAIIAFLAVMLVLTFFSNTIMNRSLPEVAAQYTSSGSITARIRGNGTVTANESFEVIIYQTRTVSEVPVRLNDKVEIGDVLMSFTGDVSEELKTAEDELRDLERQLEELLLEMSVGDNAVASAARAVQAARNALSDAQNTLAGVQYNEAAFNAAQAANNQAQAAAAAAEATTNAKNYDLGIAQAELDALEAAEDAGGAGTVDPAVMAAAVQKRDAAQFAYDIALVTSTAARTTANATLSDFTTQDGNRSAWISATAAVRSAQLGLDEANSNLTLAQTGDDVSNSLEAIKLRELRRDIEEKRDEIEQLKKDGGRSDITSLVGGIVTAVNISPGEQASPDEVLMVIEVVDRGYSLSFSVSSEQASRVTVGDQAEVDRGWWGWGEEITATLRNIRNDPQNPATNRILHFSISGDVESGSQLNLTLAQRSENYNVIVPNSAIRTDTNGDFVLVVMSRTSPLGNRYFATRVDVTILASDDTHTAVTGGLSGWDFVITTSTAPIDPGMQVRLVDNP